MHDCVLTRKRKFTYINEVGLMCVYEDQGTNTSGFILFEMVAK